MLGTYGLTEAAPEPAMMEEAGPRGAEEVARISQVKDTDKCRDQEMRRVV